MNEPALKGVRVADFTWVVAGPVATRILADQGAEVIKIERRFPQSAPLEPRRIGLQGDIHRNKRSIAINMAHPQGRELARRLVALSDIVIDNFSARVMRQWGMDYESLVKIKPDIICISMSGFGHSGPKSHYVSYGPTLQALCGFTLAMAEEDGSPAGYGYSYADMAGGYAGAFAALVALYHRNRTGRGQFIDLAQFETLASLVGPTLLDIAVNGEASASARYRWPEGLAAPQGLYKCRAEGADNDRWVAISIRSAVEWRRFIEALGSPAWSREPRFQTMFLRRQNRAALDSHIAEWTCTRTAQEVMETLQQHGVPAGLVANGRDLCHDDPQLKSRGFWQKVNLPEGGVTHLTGSPIRLSGFPAPPVRCAPEVGEDHEYVLGELLGLSAREREELASVGAFWP